MTPLEPLKIGFVGLSFGLHVAERMLVGAGREYFTLAAGCDLDSGKLDHFCTRFQVARFSSLDDLLADPAIPVVALFSGPAGRAALIRRILRAGKHVMTTKPFELDPVAARQVLEEARQLGRIVHLNSPPADPPGYLQQILRWQEQYNLGRPISCRGEMTASYNEQSDGRWFDDPTQCPAAPLFRLGIYTLNDLGRLYGPVKSVQVLSTRIRTGRPTSDNAQLSLEFANGAIGSVFASFCVDDGQHYANALTLHYERGKIFRNVAPVEYGQAEGSSRLELVAVQEPGKVTRASWRSDEISGNYEWARFYRAIRERDSASIPVDAIVSGVAVIAAMVRSERSGRTEFVS